MNDNKDLDYIDLLVAFIKKDELSPKLQTDIEKKRSKDAFLNTVIDGLSKLLESHGDKAALKEYFKNTQQNMFSSLHRQKNDK